MGAAEPLTTPYWRKGSTADRRPAISVIIPALNEEKLLPGILAQLTPELRAGHDLEIIVSDGGSSDRTLEIARAVADCVVENTSRQKQTISIGRNQGALNARGRILVFLNADTRVEEPDRFFREVARHSQDQGIAAVTCRVGVYPAEELPVDRAFHGFYNWFFFMMNRVGMAMGRGECHVMRREVFEAVQGYAAKIVAGEDYDMFRRLHTLGRVRFLNDLQVFESPRRFRRYGYLRVSASWFLNFLSVFLLRRSLLRDWTPIR
jgi:glycosyltransferase involved in cell wall biosynthesis